MSYEIWSQVTIVEPVVRIECGIAMIPVDATVILVGTSLRNKLDLHCALGGTFGAWSRSGNGHLADRVGARSDVREETITRFEKIVLHVDSVEGDVKSTLRQPVNG